MKSKVLLLVMMLIALTSCKQDPQKKAEQNAKTYEKAAEIEAKQAERDAERAINNTGNAIGNAIMAGANEAMAKIEVPEFKNLISKKFVKDIGNDIVNYVNANDKRKADHYENLLAKHIERVKKAEENKTITSEDAKKIEKYGLNLAGSVGLTISGY